MSKLEKRWQVALAAIKASYGTNDGEYGATLFVSHHLAELDQSYWKTHLNTEAPNPTSVLEILVLQSVDSGGGRDGIDTLDFTLPDDVTNYVLSVSFDESGKVASIEMES